MPTFTFTFINQTSNPVDCDITYTENGVAGAPSTANNFSINISEDTQLSITCIPTDTSYTTWNRNIFLPNKVLSGQTDFNIIFDSTTTVNEDNEFIRINIPCTSNVQVVDNVAQNGVYNIVWDFGDGTSASGTSITHTYARPGQYVITKTITFCTEPN